jgi:hypothetical protein
VASVAGDIKTGYHTYKVQVSRGSEESWFIEKRFSEFDHLRLRLMADEKVACAER